MEHLKHEQELEHVVISGHNLHVLKKEDLSHKIFLGEEKKEISHACQFFPVPKQAQNL